MASDSASSSKIRIVSTRSLMGDDELETPTSTAILLRTAAGSQNAPALRKLPAAAVTRNVTGTATSRDIASSSGFTAAYDVDDVTASPGATSTSSGLIQDLTAPTRLEGGKVIRRIIRLSSRDDVIADLQAEVEALKKSLSEQQLSNHKLEFEKKFLRKERDKFEELLTDSEAKNLEAEKLKFDLRTVLSGDFSSIEDLRARALNILNENAPEFEAFVKEELISFSDVDDFNVGPD